jgi:glycosyltransferase involved in cell wall biosynthesis
MTDDSLEFATIALLIPAWQPEPRLLTLAEELQHLGFSLLLVVDDGSGPAAESIFGALRERQIRVLRHAVNLGKGRALKTGFNTILDEYPQIRGVVTADADGQHTAVDILRVAEALAQTLATAHPAPVLGVRNFHADVPLRSRFGNSLTRLIFAFTTGTKIADTQTGLRGLPVTLLPELLKLSGERYEYEMTMLAHLCRNPHHRPLEVPIATLYLEGNRSSHFDPVRDSMRIYFVLARFYLSSIAAATIDFLGFTLTFLATHHLLLSLVIGRFSSFVNFALNKRFVFRSRRSLLAVFWRYYALAIAIGALSYALIWLLVTRAAWNVFAAKVLVDGTLSLVSFSIQRTFIFRRGEDAEAG